MSMSPVPDMDGAALELPPIVYRVVDGSKVIFFAITVRPKSDTM